MASKIVCFLGASSCTRRRVTVTTSQPDACSEPSIRSSLAYLPVPRKSRERSSTPATMKASARATVCTRPEYGGRLEVLLQKQCLVAAVGQPLDGILDRQPQKTIDFDPRLEAPAAHLHDPVAGDLVAPAAIDVRGAAQRTSKLTSKARLLADFAKRTVL